MTICTEPECDRIATRRGLCNTCYQYRYRHGTLPPKPTAPPRTCRIDNDECWGGYEGKGLCKRHYHRQYATGSTEVRTLRTAPDEVRYWSNVDMRGPGECWPWTGTIVKRTGYGQIHWDGKLLSSHVVSWELATGLIPAAFWIDHTCHNRDNSCRGGATCPHRACQNPLHLEATKPGVNLARSALTKVGQGWRARSATDDELAALVTATVTAGIIGAWRLPDCPNGHPLNGDNRYVHPERGTVGCRTCMAQTKRFRGLGF